MASGRFLVSWGGLDGNLIAAANFNQEWFQARHLQMWQKKNTNRQKGGLDWHLIAAANWPTLTRKLRHGCESGIFWCEERKNINRQTGMDRFNGSNQLTESVKPSLKKSFWVYDGLLENLWYLSRPSNHLRQKDIDNEGNSVKAATKRQWEQRQQQQRQQQQGQRQQRQRL